MLERIGQAVSKPAAGRSALLASIVVMTILPQVQASESLSVDSKNRAAMALSRYTGGLVQTRPWNLETMEIEASLPRMEKQGRLRAIRRLLPVGKPDYHVLEIAGDKTVLQEVIVRYLTADANSAANPSSSVAMTPANYRFSYKGPVMANGNIAYSFVITPRKKRVGLIKGELWLDGETSTAVRQSGYLVKSPSIFLKRITVTREVVMHDGVPEERITHLSVDTRLVGRAELTIHERPCRDIDAAAGQ